MRFIFIFWKGGGFCWKYISPSTSHRPNRKRFESYLWPGMQFGNKKKKKPKFDCMFGTTVENGFLYIKFKKHTIHLYVDFYYSFGIKIFIHSGRIKCSRVYITFINNSERQYCSFKGFF